MNVYRITDLVFSPGSPSLVERHRYIAALSLPDAMGAVGDDVVGVEFLGELIFASKDAGKIIGGSRVSLDEAKASITESHLISFEDGKPYKSLRRHLRAHGLTIDQYKTKWNLPASYPAVHPSYSIRRSEMAKASGLGVKK